MLRWCASEGAARLVGSPQDRPQRSALGAPRPVRDTEKVGADRLELSASRPQTGRSTRLSYAPRRSAKHRRGGGL
jgi:hypothetical protein